MIQVVIIQLVLRKVAIVLMVDMLSKKKSLLVAKGVLDPSLLEIEMS